MFCAAGILLPAALQATTPFDSSAYEAMVDLATISGSTGSRARAISGDGSVVVGEILLPEGTFHAFRYTDDGYQDLGTPGGDNSIAYGVSGNGAVIVGAANFTGNSVYHAFRYTETTGMERIAPSGVIRSEARGVSSDGSIIVGRGIFSSASSWHAFRYTDIHGMVDLGTLGGDVSIATAVSDDRGTIVGSSEVLPGSNDSDAFRFTASNGMQSIGRLGGTSATARGVSRDGSVIVGWSTYEAGNEATHAFMYTQSEGMTDLGTLGGLISAANAISSEGSVVAGTSQVADGSERAFLYTRTEGMVSLGTLGGTNSRASSVSGDGTVISGWSDTTDGQVHAFIYRNIMVDVDNTYAGLSRSARRLDSVFHQQGAGLLSLLDADCATFGPNGWCLSVGGRYDHALDGSPVDEGVGSMRLGYRIHPHLYGGVTVDYAVAHSMPGGYRVVRTDPAVGLFASLARNGDGTGPALRLSCSASGLRLRVRRDVLDHTEAGEGSTDLEGVGLQGVVSWGLMAHDDWLVKPFAGMRFVQQTRGAYKEEGSVAFPVLYDEVQLETTSLFAGVRASVPVSELAGVSLTVGVEHDAICSMDAMSGTIDVLGPFSVRAPRRCETRLFGQVGAWWRTGDNQQLGCDVGYRQRDYDDADTLQIAFTWRVGL